MVNVTLLTCRGWTDVPTCVRTDGQVITEISPAYRLPFWVLLGAPLCALCARDSYANRELEQLRRQRG